MHGSVTADCLLQCHLSIASRSLPSLAASTPSTRALVSRAPSLTIVYMREERTRSLNMPTLRKLRSPLDASRFLFSSLSSLHVVFEQSAGEPCTLTLVQHVLVSLLRLLAAYPESTASLRRLHIDDTGSGVMMKTEFELPFSGPD
jgi:hypothetical protein